MNPVTIRFLATKHRILLSEQKAFPPTILPVLCQTQNAPGQIPTLTCHVHPNTPLLIHTLSRSIKEATIDHKPIPIILVHRMAPTPTIGNRIPRMSGPQYPNMANPAQNPNIGNAGPEMQYGQRYGAQAIVPRNQPGYPSTRSSE
jgi:hypothetical protein